MNVLIIGPSVEKTNGGTSTVIDEHLSNAFINDHNRLKHLVSHVDGNIIIKVLYVIKCILYILWNYKKYDIVHFHTNADGSFYRKSLLFWICKFLNKKTIIQIHGHDFDAFYLKSKPFFKNLIKKTLYKSDRVIVLSEHWKAFFNREFLNRPVDIIYNGINIKTYEPCIRKPEVFNKYLFLGRLGDRKGVYDLMKAIDIIVHTHGRKDLKFYLAGDGDIDKVGAIINDKGLADNVKILGYLNKSEKKKILKEVEVVVLPSYDENLPMALIEAMSCGKVIISTYVGGIPDLVKPGFNGYLFNAGDVDQLVKYILFVNQNYDENLPICQNNINTISGKFNQDILSIELNTIYNSM